MEFEKLLDTKMGLDFLGNDTEIYKDLLDAYITDNKFEIDFFKKLISNKKNIEAATYIHRIKGASAQIGATRFAEIAQKAENILKGKDSSNIDLILDEIEELYSKTYKEVMEAEKLL